MYALIYITEKCFTGICAAASAIGLAAGYLVGGQLIEQFFVEFDRVDQDMYDIIRFNLLFHLDETHTKYDIYFDFSYKAIVVHLFL